MRLDLNPKPFRRIQSLLDLLASIGQPDYPAPAVSLLERSRGDNRLARSCRRDYERPGAADAKIHCAGLVWSEVHLLFMGSILTLYLTESKFTQCRESFVSQFMSQFTQRTELFLIPLNSTGLG